MDLLGQTILDVLNRSGKVTSADAKFYGYIAASFSRKIINAPCRSETAATWPRGTLLPVGVGRRMSRNSFGGSAVLRLIANYEIKSAISLQNLGCREAPMAAWTAALTSADITPYRALAARSIETMSSGCPDS